MPEHRRVLEPAVADDHDPGRHLHALVPVLRRPDGPAAAARSRRARARRHDAGRAGPAPHRHHLRRPRRSRRRRRGALGGDHPRGQARAPGDGARGPGRRLQGRHRRRSTPCSPPGPTSSRTTWRPCRASRARCACRPATRAPTPSSVTPRNAARSPRPASCSASARSSTRSAPCSRELREIGVDILTLGQYLRPSPKHLAGRALRPPRRVRRAQGRGAGPGLPPRRVGPDGALELPRRRPARHRALAPLSATKVARTGSGEQCSPDPTRIAGASPGVRESR